MRRLKVVLRE
jgi:toxin ParE1/3/4